MAFYKLNRKYLLSFIYLIDSIEDEDMEPDYKEIASYTTKQGDTAHVDTVERAFGLRKSLAEGWEKKPGLPKKATLNVLAAFYEDDETVTFLKFHIKHEDAIVKYTENHMPKLEFVNALFPKEAEKIMHLVTQLETVERCKNMVEEKDALELAKTLEGRFEAFKKKVEDELLLKTKIINYLDDRVIELEATLARAEFINAKFGAIGLFFVSVDYNVLTEESLFDDFGNDMAGLEHDDGDWLEDMI